MKSTVELLIEENRKLRARQHTADAVVFVSCVCIAFAALVGWLR